MTSKTFQKGTNSGGRFEARTDGVLTSSSSVTSKKTWVDSFSGVGNPNWRNQVRAGLGASTGASGSRRNYNYGSGFCQFDYYSDPLKEHKSTFRMTGVYLVGDPPFADDSGVLDPGSADADAKVKIMQQCRNIQRQFQGGVFLGELRETLQMIRSPAKALREGIDRYASAAKKAARDASKSYRFSRKGERKSVTDKRKQKAVSKALGDTWLEYAFGARPLFSDIDDAMKALGYQDLRQLIPVFAQGRSELSVDLPSGQNVGFFGVKYREKRSGTVTMRYKGACRSEAANPTPWTRKNWGLTLDNFVPVVWELIPYSFLVDYFTNIGNVLDGWSMQSSGLAWLNRTDHREAKVEIIGMQPDDARAKNFIGDSYISSSASHNGYQNSSTVFFRSAVNGDTFGVGLTDIHFKIPGMASLKWLNIAALAGSRRV